MAVTTYCVYVYFILFYIYINIYIYIYITQRVCIYMASIK